MSIRKLSTRSLLGVLCLSLVVSSGFALFLFTQTLPTLTISNPAGLTSLCASPLIAGTTANNGTAGGHESFTTAYSCTSPIASLPTLTTQSVMAVVTAASYIPTFIIDTSASTATVTSVAVQLNTQSVQSGASWCISGNPSFVLTSGTAQALATNYTCQNGTATNPTNVIWYTVTVVASTFGTVNVASFSITWKSQ